MADPLEYHPPEPRRRFRVNTPLLVRVTIVVALLMAAVLAGWWRAQVDPRQPPGRVGRTPSNVNRGSR